jgi:hypothetical protein
MEFYPPEKEKQDRDEHYIEAGNKTGIPRAGVHQAGLLQSTSHEQKEPGNEHPFVLPARQGNAGTGHATCIPDKDQDNKCRQQVSHTVEKENTAHLPGHPLHDKSCFQNKSDEQ